MVYLADIRHDKSRNRYSHDCFCVYNAHPCHSIFRTYRYSRELACTLPSQVMRYPLPRLRLRLLHRCSGKLQLLRILSGIPRPRLQNLLCRMYKQAVRMPTRASPRAHRTARARSPSASSRVSSLPPLSGGAHRSLSSEAASTGDMGPHFDLSVA